MKENLLPLGPKAAAAPDGPYLISQASFTPAFHILSHSDEPQVAYGVQELKFLRENEVLNALLPAGRYAADSSVMHGYRIAFQNCFRCHNEGSFSGRKASVNWVTPPSSRHSIQAGLLSSFTIRSREIAKRPCPEIRNMTRRACRP